MTAPARRRRSVLFVSALALDGLQAALESGADIVCVDLEDAVPPGRKDEARSSLVERLGSFASRPGVELAVRVNGLSTFEGLDDLRALCGLDRITPTVLLPKVESAEEVGWAAALIDSAHADSDLYAIIETPRGLERCAAIAQSHPRLKALFFGGFDLSTSLGCEMAWEPLLHARSRVVHAAAQAGIVALDSPYPDLADAAGLASTCQRAKALGMVGKAAKSITQVQAIRAAFTPSAQELDRARRIVALFQAAPNQPLVYEGKLVELPTVKRLQMLLALDG
jgi:(S)-citramalyl-CoA lyase